jgi:hypothetical protein
MRYSFASKAQIEDLLSEDNILELCSDASLILHHVDAIAGATHRAECTEAVLDFFWSWHDRRWPALSKSLVPASAKLLGIYAHDCFDRISVLHFPPLARQIESCLMDFAKKLNLTWTDYGDTFEPDFEAQASAFFHLARGIEDAMDEIPENIRVWRDPQDELVLAVEGLSL